jgi:hypothetical protein
MSARPFRPADMAVLVTGASGPLGGAVPVWIPGRIGPELRARASTTAARPTGTITWDDYLAQRYGARR